MLPSPAAGFLQGFLDCLQKPLDSMTEHFLKGWQSTLGVPTIHPPLPGSWGAALGKGGSKEQQSIHLPREALGSVDASVISTDQQDIKDAHGSQRRLRASVSSAFPVACLALEVCCVTSRRWHYSTQLAFRQTAPGKVFFVGHCSHSPESHGGKYTAAGWGEGAAGPDNRPKLSNQKTGPVAGGCSTELSSTGWGLFKDKDTTMREAEGDAWGTAHPPTRPAGHQQTLQFCWGFSPLFWLVTDFSFVSNPMPIWYDSLQPFLEGLLHWHRKSWEAGVL